MRWPNDLPRRSPRVHNCMAIGRFEPPVALSQRASTLGQTQLTLNGQTYAMETETSNGSCNSCHTPGGNGDTAGRIVAP